MSNRKDNELSLCRLVQVNCKFEPFPVIIYTSSGGGVPVTESVTPSNVVEFTNKTMDYNLNTFLNFPHAEYTTEEGINATGTYNTKLVTANLSIVTATTNNNCGLTMPAKTAKMRVVIMCQADNGMVLYGENDSSDDFVFPSLLVSHNPALKKGQMIDVVCGGSKYYVVGGTTDVLNQDANNTPGRVFFGNFDASGNARPVQPRIGDTVIYNGASGPGGAIVEIYNPFAGGFTKIF